MGFLPLLKAAADLTVPDYAMLVCVLLVVFIYRALHFHAFEDLLTGFRGYALQFVHNSTSPLASEVLPRCRILNSRYSPTPWLCSPHLQTAFLHFFGSPPQFEYFRKLLHTTDGGTIALDYLFPRQVLERGKAAGNSEHDRVTRIVVIIPGLTSDSADTYVKHLAHSLAVSGWRVVVANHRGLGGVSITSNQFYNAGWTKDLRRILNYLRQAYPKIPIFAVGTSLGANILIKYLGEEGDSTPLGGAVAICCPWDLLVCDRFICREWIQRFYDKILAYGLRAYATVHKVVLSQIADWDLINKSRSIREFDNYCTCVVGQFETVDTYYRKNSSAGYLHSVSIPLFCLNTLDDPVCTREAIPWDECRINANVVLGISKHGGHLAFFEGMRAHSIWWVRATNEFLKNLSTSRVVHVRLTAPTSGPSMAPLSATFADKSPVLDSYQNGLVAAETIQEDISGLLQEIPEKDTQMDRAEECKMLPGTSNGEELSFPSTQGGPFANGMPGPECGSIPKMLCSSTSSTCSESSVDCQQSTLKLSMQQSQLLTFESTLQQLLEQIQQLKQNSFCVEKTADRSEVNIESREVLPTQEPVEGQQTAKSRKESLASFYKKKSSQGHSINTPEVSTKVVVRQNWQSLWLLAYIAIVTTWPLIGSALFIQAKKRMKGLLSKVASM